MMLRSFRTDFSRIKYRPEAFESALWLSRSAAFTYPARDLMGCGNTPAIGGQANVPTSRPAPSLLELSTVCRQPPTTRSLHVLTGMSGELDRAGHSRRPRKRSCDSVTDSSSCARFSPARPLLALLLRSLSIRRSAAAGLVRAPGRQRCTAEAPAACVSCAVPSPPSRRGWPP
jgi:hypothetical protein